MPAETRARAIELCAAGQRNKTIAAELGVAESTIRGWRSEPDFDDAVKAIHAELRASWRAKSEGLGQQALDTLAGLMRTCRDPAVKRNAAKDILTMLGGFPSKTEVQHSGKIETGPDLDYTKLNDDELDTLIAITAKAKRKDPGGPGDTER